MWSLLLPAATVWYFATYRSGFPILTVTNEKMYYIYEKLVEVVKCNISRNNHITRDVLPSNCCVAAYVVSR